MRRFNVTGLCVPDMHYMVDISNKIEQIRKLVDYGSYFTINRARQYGKTTTLAWLEKTLEGDYLVASISFEGIDDESFASPAAFCQMFLGLVRKALRFTSADSEYIKSWQDSNISDFGQLSEHITERCCEHKIVLMIDEVDKMSNNRTFIHFLGMLREKLLARMNKKDYTFHSVILAGVYDIKNIKLKMINEGTYTPTTGEGKLYNSPWNIAVDFDVDMSFNPPEIATMLAQYEADYNTGMDINAISEEIYYYTSGYPFLVSRICQLIDGELGKIWTQCSVQEAVKILLEETNTLFDDLFKNLENDINLYNYIYEMLILGKTKPYIPYDPMVCIGVRYCFLKKAENGGNVAVSNRIFELLMTEYFMATGLRGKSQISSVPKSDVVRDGHFDMELCLRKFAQHYGETFCEKDIEFLERHGRLIFLLYLRPLINGGGFYHIESQLTDMRRMDIVVDFGSDQFIIELKLWKGDSKHKEAYEQLCGYLESKNASIGYLLTFDFRKGVSKETYAKWVDFDDKRIFDVMV